MGGAFCRNARTDAVGGQQTAYVNLWDPLAHGHWPGADGRFGGGEADAGGGRNGGVDDLERLRPPLAVPPLPLSGSHARSGQRAVAEAVAGLQIDRRLVPLRAPRKGLLATAQNRGRAEAHGPHRRLHWEAVQRRVAVAARDLQAGQLP